MVGAIVLIIIAVVSAGLGLVNWLTSTNADATLYSLLLWMIATVALGSALIIDGVRYYADKLGTQMNYLLMPRQQQASAPPAASSAPAVAPSAAARSSPALSSPALSNSAAMLAGRNAGGQRYRIIGKDRANGMDTELLVQASDQTAALRLGEQKGIEVRRVEVVQA